jgi:hypothetical protein
MTLDSFPFGWFELAGALGSAIASLVEDRGGDLEPGTVAASTVVAKLATTSDGLGTPERFLDSFPDPLADLVPSMPGGPPIDRVLAVRGVLRDERREPERADLGDEVSSVVGLVRSDAAAPFVSR